jgi:hypothetical protein
MPELTRFWIVGDPPKVDGSADWVWEDPALKDDESRLYQFFDPEGSSLDRLVSLYLGTETGPSGRSGPLSGSGRWEREHTKVYSDKASAAADAKKRFESERKRYERRHPELKGKQASALDPLAWKST